MFPINNLSNFKKWRIAAIAFFFLTITLYWALCYQQRKHILEALPSQTAVALTFSGFEQLNGALLALPNGMSAISPLQVLHHDLQQAFSFFKADSGQISNLGIRAVAAGFSLQTSDSLHPLIVLDMNQRNAPAELIEQIKADQRTVSSNFKGHTIYAIQDAGKDQLVVTDIQNLLLFSKFSYLVEDALIQIKNREQWWTKSINAATVQEIDFQVAFRPELIAERNRGEMTLPWEYLPDWLIQNFEWINISYDGKNWETTLKTNGHIKPGAAYPLPDAISNILPDNTAFFLWQGLGTRIRLEDLTSQATASAAHFRQYIEPWVGNEAAYMLVEPYSPAMKEDEFLILSISDEDKAQSRLKAFGDQSGLVKKYTYQTFEVRQFLSQSLIAPLLSENRQSFVNPVCAVFDGYVVFAASTSAMELWIDKYIVNQTLGNQPDYLLLKRKLAQKGNLQVYMNAGYLTQLVKQLFRPPFFETHAADIRAIQNSGIFAFDLLSDRHGNLSGKLANQTSNGAVQNTSILWKTTLGAPAITAPFAVAIGSSDTDPAILIQDSLFQLYRLSANGSILWRKQLDQPIISDIQGIDFYKNGKACYLFNTANAIWILDDEGAELVGYPLHLQSPATNGVQIVDFEDEGNKCFFVACHNGNLYGFDQFGRPLSGWNTQSEVGRIKHPLIHFKKENKDYLAVLNLSGQLFVFHRNGSLHFPVVQLSGSFFENPLQYDAGAMAPRLVCANDAGRVYVCNLSGENFGLEIGGNAAKRGCSFVFESLFGDARKDYAMLAGNQLTISGYEGKAFKEKYSANYAVTPDTLFRAGMMQLGGMNREKRQIFLFNAQGKLLQGFPLAGTTPFSLMPLATGRPQQVLVAGNMEAVYAYKIK